MEFRVDGIDSRYFRIQVELYLEPKLCALCVRSYGCHWALATIYTWVVLAKPLIPTFPRFPLLRFPLPFVPFLDQNYPKPQTLNLQPYTLNPKTHKQAFLRDCYDQSVDLVVALGSYRRGLSKSLGFRVWGEGYRV